MAVGSPALLLAPMVDFSVEEHGYYSYFVISNTGVCARQQGWQEAALWQSVEWHAGTQTLENTPKSRRLRNNTTNAQLL